MNTITVDNIKENGEYLGNCPIKGAVYSMCRGEGSYLGKTYQEYIVVAIHNNTVLYLITYNAYI